MRANPSPESQQQVLGHLAFALRPVLRCRNIGFHQNLRERNYFPIIGREALFSRNARQRRQANSPGRPIHVSAAEIPRVAISVCPLAIVSIARRPSPPVPRTLSVPDVPRMSQIRLRAAISAPSSTPAGQAELVFEPDWPERESCGTS
jgi:hypothetical protein